MKGTESAPPVTFRISSLPWWNPGRYITHRGRPLSYRAIGNAGATFDGHEASFIARWLRPIFPARWWHRFVGDPVDSAVRCELRDLMRLLGAATRRPGEGLWTTLEVPGSVLIDLPRGLELEAAESALREKHGAEWLHNPKRWPTADGYVPAGVFAAALDALPPAPRLSGRLH